MTTSLTTHLDDSDFDAAFYDWKTTRPSGGFLALVPEKLSSLIPRLQQVSKSHDYPLIGAVFPKLVTSEGFDDERIQLIGFSFMPPWFLIEDAQSEGALKKTKNSIEEIYQASQHKTGQPLLFLIFDGMLPNIMTTMLDMHDLLSANVRYAGVNAGSASFQSTPCLFTQDQFVANSVLGMFLAETLKVSLKHAYIPTKVPVYATATEKNKISRIDGVVAFEKYRDLIFSEFGVRLTRDNFYEHAVHFPFGLITSLEVLVRIPVKLEEDGSLLCIGEIPVGSTLRLLRAPAPHHSNCAQEIADEIGDQTGQVLLTFYCAGRQAHLGNAAGAEVQALINACRPEKIAGAVSLGEVTTTDVDGCLIPSFHNGAIVAVGH